MVILLPSITHLELLIFLRKIKDVMLCNAVFLFVIAANTRTIRGKLCVPHAE